MIRPGIYQHFKGPLYRVLFCAQNSTNPLVGEATEESVVIYVSLDDPHKGNLCARLESQFSERVEWPDGSARPRFEPREFA